MSNFNASLIQKANAGFKDKMSRNQKGKKIKMALFRLPSYI